jgi:hypothetical protein
MVSIVGDGWRAEILINEKIQADWIHLEARVDGDSEARALAGANWVMDSFGKGRTCMVRVTPEANTDRDFATQKNLYRGYVRFSFENVPYHWYKVNPNSIPLPTLGAA